MNHKEHFKLNTKDFRAGSYTVVDTSQDKTWGDVICVESHTLPSGWVSSVTNHRSKDFDKVCTDLISLGAIQEQ